MRGIYAITNILTDTVYYGQSVNIRDRLSRHRFLLKNNKERNIHLQRSWNKYGKDAFVFTPIQIIEDNISLSVMEKKYIDDAYGLGLKIFNCANPLDAADVSEEIRKKISNSKIGKSLSLETKIKIANTLKGNKNASGSRSEDICQKMSLAQTGNKNGKGHIFKPTEEWKQRVSKSVQQYYITKKGKENA